jgi:microcystin-dependent protein
MDDPTIPANDRFVQYEYGGGSSTFSYDFPVHAASSVDVYVNGTQLMFSQDYGVTVAPSFDGGTVTLLITVQTGDTITIVGDTPLVRTEYYGNSPVVSPSALDSESEKHVMRLQQLNTKILGCLKNSLQETEILNTVLPPTEERKGKVAAWDGTTGALSYFGDGAMDDIYLKRENNLSDIANVEAARNNLSIIDGRELVNNGTPIPYRKYLEFNRAFALTNDTAKTVVALSLMVTNMGTGIPIVVNFSTNTLWGRTLRVMGGLTLELASDGSIVIGDSSPRGYAFSFSVTDWESDNTITIPYFRHLVSNDGNIGVLVKDSDGYDVQCNCRVDGDGTVTIFSQKPFSGHGMIFGGISPLAQGGLMVNPMVAKGDIIYGSDGAGTPAALPIGQQNQVLAVGTDGLPAYRTPGDAAWLNTNIPGGAVQLNSDGEIPPSLLPINSLTYKGTFGSSTSSTGGDLPTTGILDGDLYIADSDYSSQVAAKSFLAGQWAIFSGTAWDVIPFAGGTSLPTGSVIAYAGNTIPQGYLPCNGYTLPRADYPYLFSAIGTLYNSGSEDEYHFSIPNYNSERRFLQGNTSAGTKTSPGLPELSGHLSNVWQRNTNPSTLSSGVFKNTTFNTIGTVGGAYYNDSFNDIQMQASWHNTIYGNSTTVQPKAQDVIFIIKYK